MPKPNYARVSEVVRRYRRQLDVMRGYLLDNLAIDYYSDLAVTSIDHAAQYLAKVQEECEARVENEASR